MTYAPPIAPASFGTAFARQPPEATPASGGAVERRAGLTLEEFRAGYLLPRRPVILTDAARDWPIYERGTPDYFRRRYGACKVTLLGEQCSLTQLLDRLETSRADKPVPYPCKFDIARHCPELLADVAPRFACSLPDRQTSALIPSHLFDEVNNLEVFFGGPGGKFPYLHYDVLHLHAWITQLHGTKEFILYAPDQEQYLYPNPQVPWQSSIRGHHQPDFGRYPLFRQARATRVVIGPGDTLFLPCGWWHTARSLNVTISVAFDQLGPDNWPDFTADIVAERKRCKAKAGAWLLGSYLRAIGPMLGAMEKYGAHRATSWGRR